ncbi:NAD(P)H-binding protein [Paenibacillus radicis (ex Gao et al. 2016)]|uniref:Nucleoside-diphosphate sugar epimerase n=1 Tax=Paenibacillus radicis (ex Gao et al. 2016) TaxID=1737354 RepID=A0A917M9X2_9BACL|nr:NAD(P)H-binding protein [Paenibacillus radicis (ex Gao et al. 2016)]GGG87017.1 nucleoside-diphosphate sugar epimerase [Paenibacillus radicis (ex Gao et al. 2016)]
MVDHERRGSESGTYSCLVAGATGLVGSAIVKQLLADPSCHAVTVLARRPLDLPGAAGARSKLNVIVADFEQLGEALSDVSVDVVYCALGTTIKAAGSQEAFRRVDYEYPAALADWAEQTGVKHFLVITAMGSSASSPFFYSRVKGLLQERLAAVPIETMHFFQPSLLLGHRQTVRFGETVAAALSKSLGWLMVGPLRPYRAIEGEAVAEAMRTVAKQAVDGQLDQELGGDKPALFIYPSIKIAQLAAHTHEVNRSAY